MARKPTGPQMRAMVKDVVAHHRETVALLAAGGSNPQVVAVREKAFNRLLVAEAVLAAMDGDCASLRSLGRG